MTPLATSEGFSDKLMARLHAIFAPAQDNRWMWLEVVVITLCALSLGLFLQPDNPFQVGGQFPWIWLAPVLVALRYGVMPGIASSLTLILAWLLLAYLRLDHEGFPEEFFLGGLIVTMLCGEFSAAWSARLRRAEESNHYLDERLSRITVRHLLLRLSHDRMEQEILTKPVTLREALIGLRHLTTAQSGSAMPASGSLLQLLTQYCQLESASISVASADGKSYTCSSEIGSPPALLASDPLLQHALEHKSLAHLLTDGLADVELPSPFLVVAPIQTSDGQQLGVLAIKHMPFLALNEENLQMLSVMLGYYADCVVEAAGAKQFLARFPAAPDDFAAEFARLWRMQRKFGIDSHVVVLSFANDESGRQAIAQLTRIARNLDITWQVEAGDRTVLANLMPLATKAAVDGYLLRIEATLKEYLGIGYDSWSRLAPIEISLSEDDPVASLTRATQGTKA
jgi:polysaccharide biosynthesis protein PelD